jgi:hypothetical protein
MPCNGDFPSSLASIHDVIRVPGPPEELQLARLEVAVVHRLVELQDPERRERREAHPGQADVRRPEAGPSCRKLPASTVRNVSGMTSAAEKNAPSAMYSAGSPEKYNRWCIVSITPPARVQDDVQEDHHRRDLLAYHAEQYEHVRHHDGREQLEEVLDTQVHDQKRQNSATVKFSSVRATSPTA